MNIYITFGQSHTHRVNGKTFDCDSVAVIEAENEAEGRKKAFEYFGDKWFTSYTDNSWIGEMTKYFPRGFIEVERGKI